MEQTPLELSRKISVLSEEYYDASIEAGEIAMRAGEAWLELRKSCKTDAETNKRWAITPDGKRDVFLRYYLKGLEKRISALKMELRMITGQGA